MPRYKPYSYAQGKFISIHFENQILPGSFEYTLSQLIDNELDISIFDRRYRNDATGATAYDPRILLKIVLYGYSKGIVSSRKIAKACEENVIFMALAADTRPHFTTIADFISTLDKEIVHLFRDVLIVCDEMGLIGREMFAIDGCKLPSNASKEWSGTKADFRKKAVKLEEAIGRIVTKHRELDLAQTDTEIQKREEKYVATLRKQVKKIKKWLDDNDDKPGKTGRPKKSNITDNDSAKMKTSHGVIQGYDGVATVDSKRQIVVHAEAFGEAQEHDLLEPMVQGVRDTFEALEYEDIFSDTKLTADSGFHTEANMKMLAEQNIDAYMADRQFRKRDPHFISRDRYKIRHRKERARIEGRSGLFKVKDFTLADDFSHCICPAGKRMYRSGTNVKSRNHMVTRFKGTKSACIPCRLRRQCLMKPDKTEIRQVAFFHGRSEQGKNTFTEKMKTKIDSAAGRLIYSMRIGTVEPVFANICSTIGLDHFTLRGRTKVNTQWNLFCMVHNMMKIHRFGMKTA